MRCSGPAPSTMLRRSLGLVASIFISCAINTASVSLTYAQNSATLSWQPPEQNTDGTPLTDLAGYRLFSGCQQSRQYERTPVSIDNPGITSYEIEGLPDGTCYFAATAINSAGVESDYSNEATRTFDAEPEPLPGPIEVLEIAWAESDAGGSDPVMAAAVVNSPGFITNSGGTGGPDRVGSHTFNYDHDDGGTTLLIAVGVDDGTVAGAASLTYDGEAATEIFYTGNIAGKGNFRGISIFRVDDPPAGVSEIVIDADGTTSHLVTIIYSLTGAGEIDVDEIVQSSQIDGTTVNLNVPSTTEDGIVFRFDRWWSSSGDVTSATGTQIDDQGVNSQDSRGGGLFVDGSATDTDTQVVWDTSNNHYVSVGLFVPDAAAGGETVSADSATHGHTADNIALTQANVLGVQSATHGHAVDNLTLESGVQLAANDADHGHTAENVDLVQDSLLAPAGATHGHAADNVDLTQDHTLQPADALHSHEAENVDLTQSSTLAPAGADHAHAADNVDLTQDTALEVDDATHAHAADNLALTQANLLAVHSVIHQLESGNLVLLAGGTLSVQGALHGHTADNLALTQAQLIALDSATHGHTAEQVELSTGVVLQVAGALHGHGVDNVILTQAQVLAIADALHGHQADSIQLQQGYTLAPDSALHGHTADNVGISAAGFLAVASAIHAHSADEVTFTQDSMLIVSSALHAHLVDNLNLRIPGKSASTGLIFEVEVGERVFFVEANHGTFS